MLKTEPWGDEGHARAACMRGWQGACMCSLHARVTRGVCSLHVLDRCPCFCLRSATGRPPSLLGLGSFPGTPAHYPNWAHYLTFPSPLAQYPNWAHYLTFPGTVANYPNWAKRHQHCPTCTAHIPEPSPLAQPTTTASMPASTSTAHPSLPTHPLQVFQHLGRVNLRPLLHSLAW